jgi:hypothetical protein
MASAWGKSWGLSWLNSWGKTTSPSPVVYMRPPSIPDDEPEAMSVMDIVMMWTGAQQSGLASSSVVDPTN